MKNEKQGKAEMQGGISADATITLKFPSEKQASAARDALAAEADFSHRGGSKVSLLGKAVKIEIAADDPVSLRASINSYLRLAHIIKSVDQDTE
jgi:tRNA threonylcarbamoyladenosine modification (KEOPS) complex  Pcc1 subunit